MIACVLYSEMRHLFEQHLNGSWYVQRKVITWMVENDIRFREEQFLCDNNSKVFGLMFDEGEGCMAFKLRWL